jgi:hypothetical protein
MSAVPCLEINQIIVSSLNTAVRSILTTCANNINDNFDQLKDMTSDDRLEAIIKMFGIDVDTTAKIIKPAPKKNTDGTTPKKTGKSKAEKTLPLPFWGEKTVNRTKCHGLQAGLYNQCCNAPLDGGVYCKKCQKEADDNEHGMPNRGNIEIRLKQFKRNSYEFTTPDGKLRKIYIKLWAEKKELSSDDVREHFDKNGITLNDEDLEDVFYMPEKKPRLTKKNLTNGMKEQKKKKNDSGDDKSVGTQQFDDDYQNQDDDDDKSIGGQDVPDDDDDKSIGIPDIPEDQDDDDDQETFDITQFGTFNMKDSKTGETTRRGALKLDLAKYKKDKTQPIEVYEVTDYVSKTDFKIVRKFGTMCDDVVSEY